ncbi:MAG: hypothetical protein N2A99_06460 [Carnobacterium alterfunditum]
MENHRLHENSNNVFIEIETVEKLNIFDGTKYTDFYRIIVRDDADEIPVIQFRKQKELFNFFQENSYRMILEQADKVNENVYMGNLDKHVGIAEVSGGFFFSGFPYDKSMLDTYYIESFKGISAN